MLTTIQNARISSAFAEATADFAPLAARWDVQRGVFVIQDGRDSVPPGPAMLRLLRAALESAVIAGGMAGIFILVVVASVAMGSL